MLHAGDLGLNGAITKHPAVVLLRSRLQHLLTPTVATGTFLSVPTSSSSAPSEQAGAYPPLTGFRSMSGHPCDVPTSMTDSASSTPRHNLHPPPPQPQRRSSVADGRDAWLEEVQAATAAGITGAAREHLLRRLFLQVRAVASSQGDFTVHLELLLVGRHSVKHGGILAASSILARHPRADVQCSQSHDPQVASIAAVLAMP